MDKPPADSTKPPRKASRTVRILRRAALLLVSLLLVLLFWGVNGLERNRVPASPTDDSSTASAVARPTEEPVVSPQASPSPSISPTPTPVPEMRATLTAVGDIILHLPVIAGAADTEGGKTTYDFSPSFQYVRPIFQAADLSIGNFEGTLAGPPYTGFPSFSGPDEIADALWGAGFRVIGTANNHCIDKGLAGLIRTATVFREKGFTVIGTRPDAISPMDTVVDLNGIQVGLLNYTFETPGTEKTKTINGIPMPDGADILIDSFNPYRDDAYQKGLDEILLRVRALKAGGAEAIVLSIHWGEEYQTKSVAWQEKMAQDLCDGGVDVIVGHHPHVLEEIDVLTSSLTGKHTLVYYSLGNFLGNWNYGTLGTNGKAQDGMIARITFLKNADGVTVEKGEYIPTYVVRIPKNGGLTHFIVPVLPALSDPDAFQTTDKEMQESLDRIRVILSPCKGISDLPVLEASN